MKISLIAALARNRVIGKNNKLPWHLPEDLKHFRALTAGHPVIMGRKTYESIGRPLPGRLNIVISRNVNLEIAGVTIVTSLEQAIEECRGKPGADEIFVIGGAEIYKQSLALADRLYLTIIDTEIDGDAYFPQWDPMQFKEISRRTGSGQPPHDYIVLERVQTSLCSSANSSNSRVSGGK